MSKTDLKRITIRQMQSWDELIDYPERPPLIEYGFVTSGDATIIPCSREVLEKFLDDETMRLRFIATPEYHHCIIPGTDNFSFAIVRNKTIRVLRKAMQRSIRTTVIVALILFISFASNSFAALPSRFWRYFFVAFGIVPLATQLFNYYQLQNRRQQPSKAETEQLKFLYWLGNSSISRWHLLFLPVLLCLAFTLQTIFGLGMVISHYGLVKTATKNGEVWRLLSAMFLHGGFFHIVGNVVSLLGLSIIVLKFTSLRYLIACFAISGIVGNLLSLVLYPSVTSIGASGGIMGLLGWILALAFQLRRIIPHEFLKSLLLSVFFVGILGATCFDFIDNTGHFGGLAAGFFLGYIQIRNSDLTIQKI